MVGFIVYVSQTYTSLTPYLKGIYLTLNIWRQGRNQEGWLTSEAKKKARLGTKEPDGDPPKFVRMVPRFFTDIQVLVSLTAMDSPPNIPVRASNDKAIYIVGDASGSGFGSVQWIQDSEVVDAASIKR